MLEDRSLSPVDLAVDHILDQIRLGHYSGGHRLVEGDLASELMIGRGSIREALRMLAGDGVVELIPHKGARVRRLDEHALIEIYEALSGLHWNSARICAKRAMEENVKLGVDASYKRLVQVRGAEDPLSWFLSLGNYHRELILLTGNGILKREYERMRNVHFHNELTRYISVGNWDKYLTTYGRLTDAILHGQVPEAGSIIAGHIDYLLELLRRSDKPARYT